jgi:hypothetical protein
MSTITRTLRSSDQWRQLIAEQAGSGLSQEAFCKQRQLAVERHTAIVVFPKFPVVGF